MVRPGARFTSAAVLLLIVGALLTTFGVSRHTYEAEATVFTSTTSADNVVPPAPDASAVADQVQALLPATAAEADRVRLIPEPGTYLFRVVARDQQPAGAARRANVAARDLVDAGTADPPTVSGSRMRLVIAAPATPPALQDRSRFMVGAALAFVAALGLMSARVIRSRRRRAR